MKAAKWLMAALLLVPSSLSAKARYTETQVVRYAKALDVSKLDPELSSQRLDGWLKSSAAHSYAVTWEMSDCDLKGSTDPNYVAPLCVKIRFQRPKAGGWVIIKVGTFRDGIKGAPHIEQIFIGPSNRTAPSEKLSDLPRLLNESSSLTGGRAPLTESSK